MYGCCKRWFSFNRTIVELKLADGKTTESEKNTFNRTIVELKGSKVKFSKRIRVF